MQQLIGLFEYGGTFPQERFVEFDEGCPFAQQAVGHFRRPDAIPGGNDNQIAGGLFRNVFHQGTVPYDNAVQPHPHRVGKDVIDLRAADSLADVDEPLRYP